MSMLHMGITVPNGHSSWNHTIMRKNQKPHWSYIQNGCSFILHTMGGGYVLAIGFVVPYYVGTATRPAMGCDGVVAFAGQMAILDLGPDFEFVK